MAAALSAAAVLSGCGTLDRDAVSTYVQRVESDAAEGMLLAHEAARGRAWEEFVELHAAELHRDVQDAEEKLDSTPAEDGAAPLAKQAVSLAARIRSELQSLHDRPTDRALAGRVESHLDELADNADEVESKL
jgi:hypothetical protein